MKFCIKFPEKLSGCVVLPASKSISNRALIVDALGNMAHGMADRKACGVKNISDCDDTRVMWNALAQMPETIDIMAAGTAMRFLSAFLCVNEGVHVITGTERMKNRPIGVLVDALRQLGARVEYMEKEGFPPLRITGGRHRGGIVTLSGSVSSQYVSALLMIGPVMEEGLRLKLEGRIVSRPYIEMTLDIMRAFGVKASWTALDCICVEPGGYAPVPYYVESDWSAASYWYEMVALSPDADACVELPGLFARSLQGDSAVSGLFSMLGVCSEHYMTDEGLECVRLHKGGTIQGRMEHDFTHQPDLAQTLVATCCAMGVPFRFCGLESLKIKETDRIHALRTELGKFGFTIEEPAEGTLCWDGSRGEAQPDAVVDTYEDHRMAMALAPLSARLGCIRMNDPEVVSKSYPQFWTHLRNVGFIIEEESLC